MGILSRLLGNSNSLGDSISLELLIFEGEEDLEVVGESYHQNEIWNIAGGRTNERVRIDIIASLLPEPENKFDPNAIGVWIQGAQVGHIDRETAAVIVGSLNELIRLNPKKAISLRGVIAGGGFRDDGPGMLGVFLQFTPSNFGISDAPRRISAESQFTMSTGRSDAYFTDTQDDSYDLAWMETLSMDPSKRMMGLREVLEQNSEPLSRHFAFAELEEILYSYKEVFPDSLKQFDEVCEKHHQELQTSTRAAMISKWGKLPKLAVYRQSAIRHAKDKDLGKALDWAERGVAVYGSDAFREEWVLDLQKRVVNLEARIAKSKVTRKKKV